MNEIGTGARTATPVRSALVYFGYLQLSFVLGVLVVVSLIFSAVVLVVHLAATPTLSFVQYGFQGQVWFGFGLTIWTVWAGMDHLVPAGATRRSVWIGTLSASSVAGGIAGVLSAVTVWLESLVYDSAGWAHVADTGASGDHAGPWADGWIAFALERGALVASAALAGVLVGAAFYRFQAGAVLVAVLTLPLTVLPMLAVGLFVAEDTLSIGAMPDVASWADGPVAVGVILAVVAGYAIGLSWLLLRDVPVRMRTL